MGKIVWLASYPESGGHLLSMFLANLISGSQEPCSMRDRDMIVPAENSKKLHQPFFRRPLSEISTHELAARRPTIHQELARRVEGFLFLRTQNAAMKHFGIPLITPEATSAAIYIVRDPLDIAASYGAARERQIDRTIALMGQKGRILARSPTRSYEVLGAWSENVESWTAGVRGRILCIQFEHMLADPQRLFSEIVSFLGMSATSEQIAQAAENAFIGIVKPFRRRDMAEETPVNWLKLLRNGLANRGKKLLTTQQIAVIANAHREQMRRFNYWH